MARQRISLVSEEEKEKSTLESQILSGDITANNFHSLSLEDQEQVQKILFKMASEKIEPNQGASALEFIVFGFIRIMNKKVNGMSLTQEEKEIEASLNKIFLMHDITNTSKGKNEWLFDYMEYAERKSDEILRKRKEHIDRKKIVTGEV